jgi:hypothetical protein
MKPITFYSDTSATRHFANVYGAQLQHLADPEKMFILLSLAHSLFDEQSISAATVDVDPEGDISDSLVGEVVEYFSNQDDQTIVEAIQAVAMCLGVIR